MVVALPGHVSVLQLQATVFSLRLLQVSESLSNSSPYDYVLHGQPELELSDPVEVRLRHLLSELEPRLR